MSISWIVLKEALVQAGGFAYVRDCVSWDITKQDLRDAVKSSGGEIKAIRGVYTVPGIGLCAEADKEPVLYVPSAAPEGMVYALGAWRDPNDPWGYKKYCDFLLDNVLY